MLDGFALGARHGFDPDHLAAISELTAAERGGLRGFGAGLRYASGHAAAVLTVGVVASRAGFGVPVWVVGSTLVGLGVWAAVRLLVGHAHEHDHVDAASGVRVRHTHRHHHAVGVGLVHGLGGAPAAVLAGGRGGVTLVAFTAGLLVTNGVVGALGGVTAKVPHLAWFGTLAGIVYGIALIAAA